jgi:hypothetical protein
MATSIADDRLLNFTTPEDADRAALPHRAFFTHVPSAGPDKGGDQKSGLRDKSSLGQLLLRAALPALDIEDEQGWGDRTRPRGLALPAPAARRPLRRVPRAGHGRGAPHGRGGVLRARARRRAWRGLVGARAAGRAPGRAPGPRRCRARQTVSGTGLRAPRRRARRALALTARPRQRAHAGFLGLRALYTLAYPSGAAPLLVPPELRAASVPAAPLDAVPLVPPSLRLPDELAYVPAHAARARAPEFPAAAGASTAVSDAFGHV